MPKIILVDSNASHNFIAASQDIKFSISVQKSLLCSDEPIKMNCLILFI